MSIVTTYTCDRCGHSQPSDDQMWNVAAVTWGPRTSMPAEYMLKHRALWCRQCIDQIGLLLPAKPTVDAPTPPTLEDMIREIVREEMPR